MHGWALAQETRVAEGIEQIRQSLATLEAMGVEVGHSSLLMMLAEVYWTSGQNAAGLHTLAAARALMHKNAEKYYAAELARLTGELLLQESQGQRAVDAEQHFQQARTLAHRQHARSFELRATMSLSRLWQRQGKRDAARHILAESYSWFAEGHETQDLQKAKALLEALQ
jgi:predicted ATPase